MPNRMTEFLKNARPALIAAAFLMGAPAVAMAQSTNANTSTSAAAVGDLAKWIKVCPDAKRPTVCNVIKYYYVESAPVPLASFNVESTGDPNKFVIGISVPPGYFFPPGIPISIDGTKKAAAKYTYCTAPPRQNASALCIAHAEVGADFITALKKGGTMELQPTTTTMKAVPFDFSLSGFTSAFDGPNMGVDALTKQRDDIAKYYEAKAKQRGQQLIDAQRQGKSGG